MKIKRVLIANRGEIAVRIISTAKKMGIETVVMRTESEPAALYTELADFICEIDEGVAGGHRFLDIESVIGAAHKTGCDAIHPGYGFLSENAYFAHKCQEQGVIFIGPPPDAIYKMGNKTIARDIAISAGITVARGSQGNISHHEEAERVAATIGYPVIIKAASGGGGRGMRIVRSEAEMERMFNMASSEAAKAFNDPSVFIEKYIDSPRHIEFQILGDHHGNIIHLGERECSIQRKHQKLLEEAPSEALNEELRSEIGTLATEIARAVNYHSAGTVEFLLDADSNYYFMEVNTRIQVEHPVTEMVTGIDIVELQFRIAEGEKLPIEQNDVRIEGHAIECRINAEDVQAGFAPDPGRVERLNLPTANHIRVDTGVTEGSVIVPGYDSMIAKLIVKGDNRNDAVRRLKLALDKVWIKGVKTTIPLFRMLVRNRDFIGGHYYTDFLEKEVTQYHYNSYYEEKIAAWLAVRLFIRENWGDETDRYDEGESGQVSPWLLNKRLRQF